MDVQAVKKAIGITIDDVDFDMKLTIKMMAVEQYLFNAGATNLNNELGIMCVAVGVNDLLNEGAGETKFSPAFNILANQICR